MKTTYFVSVTALCHAMMAKLPLDFYYHFDKYFILFMILILEFRLSLDDSFIYTQYYISMFFS